MVKVSYQFFFTSFLVESLVEKGIFEAFEMIGHTANASPMMVFRKFIFDSFILVLL